MAQFPSLTSIWSNDDRYTLISFTHTYIYIYAFRLFVANLPLVDGHHVRSMASGIVGNDFDLSVVLQIVSKDHIMALRRLTYLERSIAVERSNLDSALPGQSTVLVLGNKVTVETLVSLLGGLGVDLLLKETAAKTSQPTVGEHSRSGRLDVVALSSLVLLVHNNLPEVALVALGAEKSGGEILVVGAETLVAGVGLGEDVEDLDQGPEVPTDSAGPDEGRSTVLGVGPDGSLALVETVDGKAGLLVDGDLLDLVPLKDNVVPGGGVLSIELLGPGGVERISHEDTVEPHLVGVCRLTVPETTSGSSGVLVDSVTDEVGSLLVLLLASALVPPQQVHADTVVVKRVLGHVVVDDGAVVGDDQVHLVAVPVNQGLVLGQLDGSLVTLEDDGTTVPVGTLSLMVVADPRVGQVSHQVVAEGGIGRSQGEAERLELHGEKRQRTRVKKLSTRDR